jgi:hypothetical protein
MPFRCASAAGFQISDLETVFKAMLALRERLQAS